MTGIIQEFPPPHHCFSTLNQTVGVRSVGPGTMVRCSCGKIYRLEAGNFFISVWDSLTGRGHVTRSRGLWDRWVEVPGK